MFMAKKNKIISYIYGLFHGMKQAEVDAFTQLGSTSDTNSTISQQVDSNRMSAALLRGEVTQEVQELRYRDYAVAEKSSNYKYLGNGLVVEKDFEDFKLKINVDNPNGYKVQLIQDNKILTEDVLSELQRVGTYGNETKYTVCCTRNFYPRYKIESFTNKLVIMRIDDEVVELNFYASIYHDEHNLILTKGFIKEIEMIRNNKIKSDMLDIDKVSFVSYKAYGSADLKEYSYSVNKFVGINIYDGNYVIKFEAKIINDGNSLTDKFYHEGMANKYKNKEKKELTLDLTQPQKIEICDICGKEIENIYDAHIVNVTFNKNICLECLKRIEKEKNG